jgi:hypothetical protein
MICLIAGSELDAKKWAKSQNLSSDEWFHPKNVFDIYGRKGGFHTIIVPEGIDHITNDQLNRLLTAAWTTGRRR